MGINLIFFPDCQCFLCTMSTMSQKIDVNDFCVYLCYRVCVWTSLLLILLAIFNACNIISRFTRIAGELFGMLISVLFIQEAIKVCIEFLDKTKQNKSHQF